MAAEGVSFFSRSDEMTTRSASQRRTPLAKAAWALTASATALTLAGPAFAQETPLPGIDVRGAQPRNATSAKKKAKPAPVQAASAPPAQSPPINTDEVGATSADAPYNTPAGVSVVTGSDLSTYGGTDLNDVLRSQPGTFTRNSPQNAGLAVNIRGFEGSGRVNMLIDGVPQNFSFTGHEAQGFTYLDPSLVAGVDIARGAVTTAGGTGALAGVANFRTLDVEDILKPGRNFGALTSTTWGSNGVGFSEMAAAAAKSGGISIAGAVSHREPDNYENAAGVEIPGTFQNVTSGLYKVNLQLNEEQTLRFGGVFYDNDFFANSYNQNVRSQTYTAKYAYKPIGNDLIDFRLNGYYNDVTMKYGTDASPTVGNPPQGSAWGRVIDDTGAGFDITNISRFNLGRGIAVKSEYGYEFFGDDVDAFNRFQNVGGGVNPSGWKSKSAVFSETTFSKSIFDLVVGLKYDMYGINGSGNANPLLGLPPGVPSGPFHLDKDGGAFDPKITLAARVTDWLQPYITYSETLRSPTVGELFTGGNHPGAANIGFLPNPLLNPESQQGLEVGANIVRNALFTPDDSFRFKADYYHMDVADYIAACMTQMGAVYFCNTPGNSQVQGVELQGMYDAGYVFAGLSYTYTHTDLPSQTDGFGAHSYLPEHTVVTSAGVRLFDRRMTLGGRVSYFSESDVGEQNVGGFYGSRFMPAYTLVDFFSSYKVTENLEVGFNINNLFDTNYTDALTTAFFSGPNCYGSNLPGCNDTGMGRTFFLTAKAQF
jgi:hemoglobin/transferrin/lactoferrin receptor protein